MTEADEKASLNKLETASKYKKSVVIRVYVVACSRIETHWPLEAEARLYNI
jgi:hypothetical protein